MSPYIGKKFIRFLPYIGSLFLPFVAISSSAIGEKNTEHQTQKVESEKWLNESNNRDNETAGLIAQNVQSVAQVLSSSPSELTEQAKSYALGKINGALFGETQKWLSQFGTARINFAFDRKGKLDNGSLDLLLPLYDNKADWLAFSQLGYRHKDDRHTVNVGLGGRYFTPSWMYGLNTFYDHDVTGKNQRLGVGGEAWTDYVKLSANTYWRLTKWRDSPEEHGWEERPANGFDLLGEFYLPAYPNLGGKLGFEQYYGDNVALFNRDSKQKNPSLGRVGLNYTPVPLVTIGADYKYGGSGHSETLFQANLNYRFGVPFSEQFSPDSVASMRTLAGSRYDLVERNNQIVLDYRKKVEELQLTLAQNAIVGYSLQSWPTPIPVTANAESRVKRIIWQASDAFTQNGGNITSDNNKALHLTLPHFVQNSQNRYTVNVIAEDTNGKHTKPALLHVTVKPLAVKQFRIEKVPSAADGKESYHLLATLTHGLADTDIIRDTPFDNVKWWIEPKNDDVSLEWAKPSKTDADGQLLATVSSSQPLKDAKVFLEIPGMGKKQLGDVNFSSLLSDFNLQSVKPPAEGPLLVGNNDHIFTAVVTNKQGEPLKNQKVDIKWYPETLPEGVKWSSVTDKTDDQGQLFATLSSTKPATGIKVGASMEGGKPVYTDKPVNFVIINADGIQAKFAKQSLPVIFTGDKGYTFTVVVSDKQGHPLKNQFVNIKWYPETLPDGVKWSSVTDKTDEQGQLFATLSSTKQVTNPFNVEISLDGGKNKIDFHDGVTFHYNVIAEPLPMAKQTLFADGVQSFTFKAKLIDKGTNAPLPEGLELNNFIAPSILWAKTEDGHFANVAPGLKPFFQPEKVGPSGEVSMILHSDKPARNVKVGINVNSNSFGAANNTITYFSDYATFVDKSDIRLDDALITKKTHDYKVGDDDDIYQVAVVDSNKNGLPYLDLSKYYKVAWTTGKPTSGNQSDLSVEDITGTTTDDKAFLTAKLKSKGPVQGAKIILTLTPILGGNPLTVESYPVDFQ
ncbi:inverse autotransporter beta domain-containing protein [Xenorhabdus doucetiae]|uniref:Adhesin/invasin n=2 Tax=Xenorhabdus doucetiae TaxID=351671 RepID=A0A068QNV6_9GAMM|nr:inverse autotransporter beta-barrel domain-containing protein [Xenorhabdus doucetiae]TYO97595.1 adhesin/invasin [Xenorhabdus doucetiae]CDG16251.1 putative invasin [Xenorhabdus doucetiae]